MPASKAESLPPVEFSAEGLPPGAYREGAQLLRKVPKQSSDGSEWEQVREVATTLEEAKADRKDFYHPELGWIRNGLKLERDRELGSVLTSGSGLPEGASAADADTESEET